MAIAAGRLSKTSCCLEAKTLSFSRERAMRVTHCPNCGARLPVDDDHPTAISCPVCRVRIKSVETAIHKPTAKHVPPKVLPPNVELEVSNEATVPHKASAFDFEEIAISKIRNRTNDGSRPRLKDRRA